MKKFLLIGAIVSLAFTAMAFARPSVPESLQDECLAIVGLAGGTFGCDVSTED